MAWNEKRIQQERKERREYFTRKIPQSVKERIYELSATHTNKQIATAVGHSMYAVSAVLKDAPRMMLPENRRPENKAKKKVFDWNDYKKGDNHYAII